MVVDFEMKLEMFYRQIVESNDTVIDVGAHSGRHSYVLASLVGLKGSVLAFEPNPIIIKQLKNKSKYFIDKNIIKIKQFATSNKNTQATFVIANDRPEESGLLERIYNGPTSTTKINVKVIKLDSICNEINTLKFIKIDVEGAEYHTLLGANEIIKKFKPIMAFEFGKASYSAYSVNPSDVYEYFENLNYKIYSIYGDLLSKDEFITESKVQNFWDYIASPNNKVAKVEKTFRCSIVDNHDRLEKLEKLYIKILQRGGDEEGINYYNQRLIKKVTTFDEIENLMRNSQEYMGLHK